MKLLLTGATGFVGRNLLLRAVAEYRYEEIYVVVRSIEKLEMQLKGDGFECIPSRIKPVLSRVPEWKLNEVPQVEHVIHAAGVISARTREEYFRVNVEGTLSFLRALPNNLQKVVILSSQAAAGPCRDGEAKVETDKDEPVTWYGESKLEMEKKVQSEFSSLPFVFLRPPMVFGPRDKATLPLFRMVQKPLFFKAGFKPKYYSYISVFDLVSAVFLALEDPDGWWELRQRCFYVAASTPVSDKELITSVAAASNRKGMLFKVPQPVVKGISKLVSLFPAWTEAIPNLSTDRARELWPGRWVVCSRAFEERFKWKPFESLAQTLKQTREWYIRTGQLPDK